MRRRAIVIVVTLGFGAGVGVQGAAAARLTLEASVRPGVVRHPTTLTYSLKVTSTSPTEERFSVHLASPSYRFQKGGPTGGHSIKLVGGPDIVGPAEVIDDAAADSTGTLVPCSSVGAGAHGYAPEGFSFDLSVPPGTTSTVVTRYRAGVIPWLDLDYRLGFQLSNRLITGGRGTLERTQTIRSPQPRVAGRVGVHIRFWTTPRSAPSTYVSPPRIRLGRRLWVRGRTTPAIPGQHIALKYARLNRQGRVAGRGTVGRVRVGKRGRFRLGWRPSRPGRYELWATYTSQRRGLRSDETCPRAFVLSR